jgi:hypothetical protein
MREKSLTVYRDYGNFRMGLLYIYKFVSEYAKSFLACMENTLIEINVFGEVRQEYCAVYGEYAD